MFSSNSLFFIDEKKEKKLCLVIEAKISSNFESKTVSKLWERKFGSLPGAWLEIYKIAQEFCKLAFDCVALGLF